LQFNGLVVGKGKVGGDFLCEKMRGLEKSDIERLFLCEKPK
jgi:hypothetical protein